LSCYEHFRVCGYVGWKSHHSHQLQLTVSCFYEETLGGKEVKDPDAKLFAPFSVELDAEMSHIKLELPQFRRNDELHFPYERGHRYLNESCQEVECFVVQENDVVCRRFGKFDALVFIKREEVLLGHQSF
jgi:hypothetical protein